MTVADDIVETMARAMAVRGSGLPPLAYIEVARAALAALSDAGFAVVPLEPTKEMEDAVDGGGDYDWANRFIYRGMIFKFLGKPYSWRVDG